MTGISKSNMSRGESRPTAGPAEPELISRTVQAGLGLLTGIAVYGAAVGGLFVRVFAYGHGRDRQSIPAYDSRSELIGS